MYAADGKIRVVDISTMAFRDVPFSATLEMPDLAYKTKKYDFDRRAPQQVLGIVTPALSPDGKSVVFQALNDLWVMEIGKKPKRLTDDSFYEVDPAWSADGRYLAYSSDKAGTEDIYVRDMVTNTERRVTSLNGAEVSAAWSPDGRTIAFQNQAFQTHTVDVVTGELRQVLPALFAPGKPSWSPDGNTIALAARMRYSTRFREGHNQILTVNLTTGEQKYYPPGEQFATITTRGNDGPAWSPDGKWMALVLEGTLHVIPVDSTGKPTGAAGEDQQPRDRLHQLERRLELAALPEQRRAQDGQSRRKPDAQRAARSHVPQCRRPRASNHPRGQVLGRHESNVQTNVDIEIQFNRIKSVTPHTKPLHGPNVIDASNLFVMPGLWDTHFHREREIRFFADRTNRAQLAYGMTSTLAPGDVAYSSVENREATKAGAPRRAARIRLGRAGRRRPYAPGSLPRGRQSWLRCLSRCRGCADSTTIT